MTHEFTSGTYRQTNLTNESDEYLAKREELRLAEIELMEHRERVAAQRRALPQGAALQDYEFLEGPDSLDANHEPIHTVRAQRTFHRGGPSPGDLPLDVRQEAGQGLPNVHNVDRWSQRCSAAHRAEHRFCGCRGGGSQERCAIMHAHVAGTISVCSARVRIPLNTILAVKDANGGQDSSVSVFTKDADNTVRHFYSAHPRMAPEIKERGIDLLAPVWNFMDLTPQGRREWYASLAYGTKARA